MSTDPPNPPSSGGSPTAVSPPPRSGADLIPRILAEAGARGYELGVYPANFDAPEKIDAARAHYRASVAEVVPAFGGSAGCDLGCWYGFSTLLLGELGAGTTIGVDVDARYVETARRWCADFGVEGLRFLASFEGIVPLQSGSVDWVVINQVFCNAVPASIEPTLAEATRILRRGGRLILSDSNNPHCPDTLERLRRTYARNEIGGGTVDAPDGPHYHARRRIIARLLPGHHEEDVAKLARETAYLGGAALVDAVHAFAANGVSPASIFDPRGLRATCEPGNGRANGNITDPYRLCAIGERLGLRAHVTVSPGGDRVGDDVLHEQLRASQGFYVYGEKTA